MAWKDLDSSFKSNIANSYVKVPRDLSEYSAYRGVTDFTDIAQFNQFESGYSFLFLLQQPTFMTKLASVDGKGQIATIVNQFAHILEYEFRGLDGLPDITTENATITNGVVDINMINKVNQESAVTVSMSYFEKSGLPITKYSELYTTGIKDPRTQAKTYHGLIAGDVLKPGYENEVFTMLYVVTDNTYLEVEKSVLLTNAQLTGAKLADITNSSKGEIANKEISLEFQCFPVTGSKIDAAAKKLVETATGVTVTHGDVTKYKVGDASKRTATLNSNGYDYAIVKDLQTKNIISK